MKNKYEDYIMRKLRDELFFLDENDTSRDDEINAMSKDEVFEALLNAEGIYLYGHKITTWIEDVYGVKLNES